MISRRHLETIIGCVGGGEPHNLGGTGPVPV